MRTMTTTVATAAIAGAALLGLAACGKSGGDADKAATADGAAATAPAAAASVPVAEAKALMRPRPGSWKITTSMPGVAGSPTMPAVTTCVTPEMVADDRWAQGQRPAEITCTEQRTGREGNAVVTHSVCTMQGRTMTSEIRAEGDFDRRYTVTNTTTTKPAPVGMPNPMVMVLTAERVGDC